MGKFSNPTDRRQLVKKNSKKKYAVACVTSMGLRITPENRMAVHNSNRFLLQATSAETNASSSRRQAPRRTC